MMETVIKSTKFAVAACSMFLGGMACLPFAVIKDCDEDRGDFPRGFASATVSGLGVIGEYAYILAKIL